jgi:hypothetical protein
MRSTRNFRTKASRRTDHGTPTRDALTKRKGSERGRDRDIFSPLLHFDLFIPRSLTLLFPLSLFLLVLFSLSSRSLLALLPKKKLFNVCPGARVLVVEGVLNPVDDTAIECLVGLAVIHNQLDTGLEKGELIEKWWNERERGVYLMDQEIGTDGVIETLRDSARLA